MESNEKERLDGKAFLDHLRGSGISLGADDIEQGNKDDTIKAGNREGQRQSDHVLLADLFQAPFSTESLLSSISSDLPPKPASVSRLEPSQAPPPPASKPPAVKQHSRGVSWGPNLSPLTPPTDRKFCRDPEVHKAQHLKESSNGRAKLQRDGATAPAFSQRSLAEALRNPEDARKVNLFEAEVESALLRAVEERQGGAARSRGRTDTGSSSIFSNVPDSNAHDFVVDGTPSLKDDNDDSDHEEDDHLSQRRESAGTNSAGTNNSVEQTKPLLKKKSTAASRHSRKQSVEQSLFDVTTAMLALHKGNHNKHLRHIQQQQQQQQSSSSAEEFAANAMRIDDNHQKKQPDAVEKSVSPWSVVKRNLPTLREDTRAGSGATTDASNDGDDDDDDDDVESHSSGRESPDIEEGGRQNSGSSFPSSSDESSTKKHRGRKKKNFIDDKFKDDWQRWTEFFRPHQGRFNWYIKTVLLYIMLPLLAIAAILFYAAGNPRTNVSEKNDQANASASYILLFVCRQVVTFSMALAMQGIIIDFVALNTRALLTAVGPVITLLIVQSRGWPHILFWWSIFDFAMLSGGNRFVRHWLYYQDLIGLFNEENPSGYIANNYWYIRCLSIAVALSVAVAVKRFLIGLYLGRQQFSYYGAPLAKVMNKMLLISEVADFAKHNERSTEPLLTQHLRWSQDLIDEADDGETTTTVRSEGGAENVIDPTRRDPLTGSLHFSEKLKLMQLLDQWEEPETQTHANNEIASISAVLRFRKALTFIQQRYPFSYQFGAADSREACIESSQKVYGRLMKHTSEQVLQFETLALLAVDGEGQIDQQKAKALVKLFRPDREGNLTMLDFVKSVDSVYKEFRFLQATIDNSARLDVAFEHMFNWLFYLIVFMIILAALELDPLALFLSLSSVILGFAFIIGSASSKYFEGVIFILARRPYGIGDLISISNIEENASLHGSLPWCVENVTLFETIVRHLPTNEQASLSNGSLANSRVINWARSPQAQFHIFLNFPLDTPFEKVVLFKCAIEEYMKARPREWRALNGFRANRVVANENYIEWLVVIQHREAWQQVGQVLDSKANLSSYCQEVARQLGMRYVAPSLPVELKYAPADGTEHNDTGSNAQQLDADALTREFQSIARHKHNIRTSWKEMREQSFT